MAPTNPPSGSDRPLTGLSLYAGISLSGQPSASGSDPTQHPSTQAQAKDTSAGGATTPITPASATSSAPSSASGWSAALRFAPRQSSSSSSAGGSKAKAAKARQSAAALVAPSFASSSALPETSDEGQGSKHAATPVQKSSATIAPPPPVRDVHGRVVAPPRNTTQASTQPVSIPSVPAKDAINTTTLVAPSTSSSMSKYRLPVIRAPPETRIPQDQLDADKHMARQAAIARGEAKPDREMGGQDGSHNEDVAYGDYDENWRQDDDDDDVNGFRQSEAGVRANKKRKYKKRRANSPSRPAPVKWDADYDPRIPNDYSAWKDVVRTRRETIRQREADEQRREQYGDLTPQGGEMDDEQGEAEGDEEKLYLSPPRQASPPWQPPPPPPPPSAPPGPPPPAMTGEEAYQRRLAMTQESGESAYQRRLAMSQQQQQQQQSVDRPQPSASAQSDWSRSADEASSPPTAHPPRDLDSARSAAAAIAARLSQSQPQKVSFVKAVAADHDDDNDDEDRPDPAAFAEKLMAKWGHTQGQGLGAEGNQGRTEALVMEKVKNNNQASAGHAGWDRHQSKASRGKFTSVDPRTQEDLEKYGRPSEVVYLGNVMQPGDEVEQDLADDIASECNKHGIVERVALHPASGGCFVRFTGPAGAWKAIRELNGRFFAGSQIRARYYDRARFDAGNWEGVMPR